MRHWGKVDKQEERKAMSDIQATQTVLCPECGQAITVHPGYVTWCANCNWNLQPQKPPPPKNMLQVVYAKLGERQSQALFERLHRAVSLAPRLTVSKFLAYVFASIVYLTVLGFVVLAVWLPIRFWTLWPAIVGGVLMLNVAWLGRPRLGKWPNGVLSKDEYPALYGLVGRVSKALGATDIDGILISRSFNAAYSRVGWRGNRLLIIGLPLFDILDERERIALIAHELAHGINGDSTRGLYVGTALRTITEWYRLQGMADLERSGLDVVMVPAGLLLVLFTWPIWPLAYVLSHLLWRDTQRAEYLADYLAATVAGSEAVLSLLGKLHYGRTVQVAVEQYALNSELRDVSIFEHIRRKVETVPQHEIERIRRVELLTNSRLDIAHPPTGLRQQFLQERYVAEPRVEPIPSETEQICRELSNLKELGSGGITVASSPEPSALKMEGYLGMRAARGDRAKFEAAMSKVPDVEPEEYDRLSEALPEETGS